MSEMLKNIKFEVVRKNLYSNGLYLFKKLFVFMIIFDFIVDLY